LHHAVASIVNIENTQPFPNDCCTYQI